MLGLVWCLRGIYAKRGKPLIANGGCGGVCSMTSMRVSCVAAMLVCARKAIRSQRPTPLSQAIAFLHRECDAPSGARPPLATALDASHAPRQSTSVPTSVPHHTPPGHAPE